MTDCIFCKIIAGEIPSVKVWEDDNYLAILDIFPNTLGLTLVVPKKHHDSYIMDMDDKEYQDYFLAAKKVAKIVEKGLNVVRTAVVMEGTGVNHAHIKIFPLHGLQNKDQGFEAGPKAFFDKYPGYLTTWMGMQADLNSLNQIAAQIRKRNGLE
jgi:diadenosine tetraphosphate (Ap4A) HIT family hydrolase